jgi:hypothetical protein
MKRRISHKVLVHHLLMRKDILLNLKQVPRRQRMIVAAALSNTTELNSRDLFNLLKTEVLQQVGVAR